MEAFVNVGTARRFAHGVETAFAQFGFEGVDGFKMCTAFAEPFREAGLGGFWAEKVDLNQGFGDHEPTF